VARNRLDAARARTDTRDWAKARRERTRHLIELGGLIIKADLVELLDDDRATLLGALLDVAGQLRHGRSTRACPQLSQMAAAARWTAPRKLRAVLSYRVAMALNCLSLAKKVSIRWRSL